MEPQHLERGRKSTAFRRYGSRPILRGAQIADPCSLSAVGENLIALADHDSKFEQRDAVPKHSSCQIIREDRRIRRQTNKDKPRAPHTLLVESDNGPCSYAKSPTLKQSLLRFC